MRISDWSSDVCSSDLLQLWTFSTQAQLRYKMAATTVCIQRRLEARGPGCQGFFVRRKRSQSRKLGEHVMVVTATDAVDDFADGGVFMTRSEEHTSELQSLMRISYAVFCLKKKKDSNRQ